MTNRSASHRSLIRHFHFQRSTTATCLVSGLRGPLIFSVLTCFIFVLALLGLLFPASLSANPSGGQVVAGQAAISGAGSTLTINQLSERAIIQWQDFSISAGNTTSFVQPSSMSAVLNRVVGGNPSAIHGRLQANGQVYLINPNGILVGPSGVIKTSGFVASTLDVSDEQFLSGGDLTFKGNSEAAVVNLGKIGASEGDVILIARKVENHGKIKASHGTAALAAGQEVLVKASGEERVFVQPESGRSEAQVNQAGKIRAATAEIKAAGGNEYSLAIRHSGETRATGVVKQGGRIMLSAGGNSGISHSGKLVARKHTGPKSSGGSVRIEAKRIELAANSKINTSAVGKGDGGEVLIGGGYQGADPSIRNAETVTVEEGALIISDAATEGKGGKVIVWSDDTTTFGGKISARGGSVSGDGGFAEVSGRDHLLMTGSADLRANHGAFGTLLLDPGSVAIKSGSNAPTAANDTFYDTWIANQLNSSNLTISTSSSSNGSAETITVEGAVRINWSTPTTLSLLAGRNIVISSGAQITNTHNGSNFDAIVMEALGGLTGNYAGISMSGSSKLTTSGSGNISLTGVGGDGTGSSHNGITITTAEIVSTGTGPNAGKITLDGTGTKGEGNIYGIRIDNGKIRSVDGDISLTAQGGESIASNHYGLMVTGSAALIESTGTGSNAAKIILNGTAGSGGGASFGIRFSTSTVRSVDGDITITGTGGNPTSGNSQGININEATIGSTGSASITFISTKGTGSGGEFGITTSGVIGGPFATGDITINANSVDFGATLLTLQSSGHLTIQPRTTGTTVGIGNGAAGTLKLTSDGLNGIQPGFASITLGHASGTGKITITDHTFKDDVIIRSPDGNADIVLSGVLSNDAGSMTLIAARTIHAVNDSDTGALGSIVWAAPTTLTLEAGRNILMDSGTIFSNTYNGDNFDAIVMNAAGGATGAYMGIELRETAILRTTGSGNITLTGIGGTSGSNANGIGAYANARIEAIGTGANAGSITLHGTGVTGSSNNYGIRLEGAHVISGGGDILITGSGGVSSSTHHYGVMVTGNTKITSTGVGAHAGKITIDGTAGSGGGGGYGVRLTGNSTIVSSVDGDISITGQGGPSTADDAEGINLNGAKIYSTGSASITLTATRGTKTDSTATPSKDFVVTGAAIVGGPSAQGDITINADDVDWASTFVLQSTGDLVIQPRTSTRAIGIGDGAASSNRLFLDNAALDTIKDGFSSITIGHAEGSGSIDVRSYTFKDDLIIRTPIGNGDINLEGGALATGTGSEAGSITLLAGRNILLKTGSSITTQGELITINSDRDKGSAVDTGGGRIDISGANITSNGGDIIMGGGSDPLSEPAENAAGTGGTRGIRVLNDSHISSGAGDIYFRAKAGTGAGHRGIQISAPSIVSTTSGNIFIHGIGGIHDVAGTGTSSQEMGVAINGTLRSDSGDINITGIAQDVPRNNSAAILVSTDGIVETDNGGTITFTGIPAGSGSGFYVWQDPNDPRQVTIGNGSGGNAHIVINSDKINFKDGSELKFISSGTLTFQPITPGTTVGIAGGSGTLSLTTTRLGAIQGNFSEVIFGSDIAGKITATASTFTSPIRLISSGDIAINGAFNTGSNQLALIAGGIVTQTGALTAGSLRLGGNGNFILEHAGNSIGTLAKDGTGSVSLLHNGPLTVGTVDDIDGVTASTVDLRTSTGELTLDKSVTGTASGDAVVLSTPSAFINNAGASAISTPAGRWLVYSNHPDDNTFGGLASGELALWNHTIAANAPATISQTGNRYLFASSPGALTVTAILTAEKSWGETYTFPTPVAGTHYEISGFVDASVHGGAFLADDATTIGLSGAPILSSTGAAAEAAVSGTPYTVNITAGDLATTSEYTFGSFVSGGGITVIPRALTITADSGQTKVYGDSDPTLSYVVGGLGLLGTDTLSGALSRASGENVGAYAINQGSLTAGSNYSITFVGANFQITPRAISVSADAGQTKVYGDDDPTFAFTVNGLGLILGDSFSGELARVSGENVGTYAINQGNLSAGNNYTISFTDADFQITPRVISIVVDAGQSKAYGDADPALTYTINGPGFLAGDGFTGALSRASGENVGSYTIHQGSLTAGPNYAVTYAGDQFEITQRAITITVVPGQHKTQGEADPSIFAYTHSSLGAGAPLSGLLARLPGEDAGNYAITRGTLTDAANPNYAIDYIGADFSIEEKSMPILTGDLFRFTGQPNPPLIVRIEGVDGSETVTTLDYLSDADLYSRPGVYAIYPTGTSSGDYDAVFRNTSITIVDNPLVQRDLTAPFEHFNPTDGDGGQAPDDQGTESYEARPFPGANISSLSSGEVAAEEEGGSE